MSGDRHVGGASSVMSARTVSLSVSLSLLALLPSLFAQYDESWTAYSYPDQYSIATYGPPDHSNWNGPPGHNKWQTDNRGPPGGRGPPGLRKKHPPGWNKVDDEQGGPPGLRNKHPPGWNKESSEDLPSKGSVQPVNNDRDNDNNNNSDNKGPDGPSGPDDYVPDSNKSPENRQCQDEEFRCRNNECVPRNARCDNKVDCRDSSDEELCLVNRNQKSGCVLPEQPEGGRYQLKDCESKRCTKHPGDTVPLNSVLTYSCKNNYILSGNTISICIDNEWYGLPSCHKVCPPLNSTTVDIICSYQDSVVSCSERIVPGTRATLACKSSYKLPLTNDPAYREITCLEDGLWDRRVFRCLPECGTSIAHGNTLIVNGFEAKVGVFPWHVGIYAKKQVVEYEQICGGTLISNNLIVSAAHCFYDEIYNEQKNASDYAVAAGKQYRDWDANEEYAQKSMVDSVRLAARYIGARGNFAEDIALLKLRTPFELTTLVRPVCMDWDNIHEREQLQLGQAGKVVGWGKNIQGEPSRSLQEIAMPFVPYQQCLSAVPSDFQGFITSDKFCAGYLNGSSVCDGDSGGGLSFEKNNLWYLRGVVSVSPAKGDSCDYNSYVGFTSVSHFRDWIREIYVSDT